MASQSFHPNRSLNVYSIPPELLEALSVRSIQSEGEATAGADNADAQPEAHPLAAASSAGLGCQTCPGAAFDTPEDHRAHFKTDWHRYNAKAKLNASKTVTADEFDNVVDGVSSISGSASASSASSEDRITRLLKKTKVEDKEDQVDSDEEAELADMRRRAHLRTAVIWFQAKNTPPALGIEPDTQIGVYRSLFPSYDTAGDYLNELKRLQLGPPVPEDEERRIGLFMVAGGHFAGMVISLRPRGKSERQEVKGAGDVRVLQHKTFHRYTTRRKQGGSQGLNDNAKSKAVSAGAMLRRYGEQALQDEIRELLSEWEEDLEMCERIFIRASTHGKKSFWGYDGAVLDKTDPRIRSFPFPTRRPTQQELLRCWHELTRVKVSHLSAEALAAQDEAYIASLQPKKQAIAKPVPAPTPAPAPVPKLSPEEEARQDRAKRLEDMVRKGRVDAVRTFSMRYPSEVTPATLGLAAMTAQEEVLRFLLLEAKLDPTTPLEGGKRAYDMAPSKNVRNVFRRIAFDHPTLWDWQAAHVPSGLSEEAEAGQGAKKAERRRGLREKMKERERARAEAEPEPEPEAPPLPSSFASLGVPSSGPQKLGGRLDASSGLAGLSPEMRAQIERERRARAAEARFKRA
ncbi:hypothetical protein CC85DRAFT_286070 [Cutaneotrichosporon oleaginosum]|uniref:VLRF1 domain-containing protein n=1 Tax=Cutaneotrichosporon oleaginosum TaxID=879819 RepID=A0A0J1B2K9_9TREE|nr:uncharacterized protein CC85DRAFT_286070 [Cutaneotrichosporon oleaginosum]KLT41834.1 hypothetical protein CC85DRAFT_286070 [Cutaneotrichosporon oleaginosum]TXT14754.1 hypothetical protein COLE_00947 [Cutaneotrichosporon oleaginosum]